MELMERLSQTILKGLDEVGRQYPVLTDPAIKESIAKVLIENLKPLLTEQDVTERHEDIRGLIREKFAELERKLAELKKEVKEVESKVDKVEETVEDVGNAVVSHHKAMVKGIDELGKGQISEAKDLGKIIGYQEVILEKLDYKTEEIKSKIEDESYKLQKEINRKGDEVVDKFYDRLYDLERDLSRF